MGIVNKKVFNKSYMLEILGKSSDGEATEVKEVFTFSIPPKSEEFDFGQRVTETKTFGGSVIDRYGNDTIRIVLSGSTGNEDNKFIYRGKKAPKYLNGESEIFELQRILKKFHQQDKLGDDITIYLYDLSKMNVAEFVTLRPSRNWWQVFIKDFKIKRDDSKPQFYNYTLEMIAFTDDKKKEITGLFKKATDFVDSFTDSMELMQNFMEYTKGAVALIEETANTISKWEIAYKELLNMSDKGASLTTLKNLGSFSRILTGNTNNTLYNSAKSVLAVANKCTKWFCGGKTELEKAKAKIQNSTSYAIMFDSNGGSSVARQTVEYSSKAEKPKNPTRNEYAFDCWCSDRELTTEYDFSTEITKNIILYAKWNLAIATVTFSTNFGSYVNPVKVIVGEKLTLPENPTKREFVFKEWCTDIDGQHPFDIESIITGNLTLYATWKDACSVTFDTDGGSDITEQTVENGGLVVYPITPTKENFIFSHWCLDAEKTIVFDFSRPIMVNTTLYAVFVQTTNKVTFNSNSGTDIESQYVKIGQKATAPQNPEKIGCDFVCWCTDSDCTNEFIFTHTVINSSITLYAKWRVKELLVDFISDGNSFVQSQSVRYKEKAIFPPIPTKDGFVFVMWQTRSEEKTVHTGNYETVVVYEEDGVTPKIDEATGEAMTESVEIMDYEYTEFDFNTEIMENLNLYAKWFGGE